MRLSGLFVEVFALDLVSQRSNRRVPLTDAALTNELAAGLDYEFFAVHFAEDLAGGDDFQSLALDFAVQITADDDMLCVDSTLEVARAADRDVAARFDVTLDCSVDMQGGIESQFSAEFASRSDNCRPARLYLSLTALARESHCTRVSFSNSVSYWASVHCMNGSGSSLRWRCRTS